MGRKSINGECPFISERDSRWCHEAYQCNYTGSEVGSDEYFHLCRYDEKAIRECPMRRRDYEN